MSPLARVLLAGIGLYRVALSPLIGPTCRFAPSCSAYAAEAIRRHGALRGAGLAARRLLRCHPLHPGGWDPVPGKCEHVLIASGPVPEGSARPATEVRRGS